MRYEIVAGDRFDHLDLDPSMVVGFYQDIKEADFRSNYEKIIRKFPNVDIIGCSTESNIYNHIPYVDMDEKHSCVYLFLELGKDSYGIHIFEMDERIVPGEKNEKKYDAIVLSSGYSTLLDEEISLLKAALDIDNLFGALAGVSGGENGPKVFYNGEFYSDRMLILSLDKNIYRITGLSIHQFEPVGFELDITRFEKNVVYELDNRPALDVLNEIVGTITSKKIQSFSFPFFLKRANVQSFEESPLASIRDFDTADKTVTLYRNVKEQDKLKLSIPISSKEQIQRLKRFHNISNGDSVAFVFNCVGIKQYLGMMEYVYLMDLKRQLNLPFIGFHSFGEIGSLDLNGETVLHNQTISLAVLSSAKDRK